MKLDKYMYLKVILRLFWNGLNKKFGTNLHDL